MKSMGEDCTQRKRGEKFFEKKLKTVTFQKEIVQNSKCIVKKIENKMQLTYQYVSNSKENFQGFHVREQELSRWFSMTTLLQKIIVQPSGSQWLVPRVAVAASPGNFLGMKFFQSYLRPTESEILWVGPGICFSASPPSNSDPCFNLRNTSVASCPKRWTEIQGFP